MNLLNDFFSNKKIWKFKKGWGKIGLWIPLNDFFLPKKILKFKRGSEKIGGFPYLIFFFK